MIKNLFDIKKQKEKNCTNYILTVKEGKKAKYILIAITALIAIIILISIYSIFLTQNLKNENELYKKQLQMADEKLEKLEEKSETIEKMVGDIQKISVISPSNGQGGPDTQSTNELKTIKKNSKDPGELLKKIYTLDKKLNDQIKELAKQKTNVLIKKGIFAQNANNDTPDIWPTRGTISSPFGLRTDPISGQMKIHEGVDIAAEYGSPVYATASGTVTQASYVEGYGNLVEIQHAGNIVTRYGHNSIILVNVGQKVEKGNIIALIGNTGYSTGPHCHYEVRIGGTAVNPIPFMQTQI